MRILSRPKAAIPVLLFLTLLTAVELVGCRAVGPARRETLPILAELSDETRIDRSLRVAPGVYAAEDLDNDAAITVVADNVTLDLTGVVIDGAPPHGEPDSFHGVGIRAEGVSGLRIIGGTIRGYRVAIEVIGGSGHTIERCDLSGNFRERLRSTPSTEVESDWLWPHENDGDEWVKRYGAGLHLKEVCDSEVSDLTVRAGQNGIILSHSSGILVRGNDASYLSGWGLALWRTTDSTIRDNTFDFCVRGYSHGEYARGQDSAGILVFEQSSRNVFENNSATHGGDGFFLFAGNETLKESGEGGSNDNLVIGNDFSYAVANAIEATFSSGNQLLGNRLWGSNYGVWAGYSRATRVTANRIGENVFAGVAIEHGVDNVIFENEFSGNSVGVSLWWDEDPALAVSAFARRRSTESTSNFIVENRFDSDSIAIELRDAESTIVGRNTFEKTGAEVVRSGRGTVCEPTRKGWDEPRVEIPTAPQKSGAGTPLGRAAIFIDEWGPYDGTGGLRAWPRELTGVSSGRVHLLGPDLPYRIDAIAGEVEVTPSIDRLPTTVEVTPRAGSTGLLHFTFVAMTEEGEITVRGALLALEWKVEYRTWEAIGAHDPPGDWQVVRASAPIATEERTDLRLEIGAGSPANGVPSDHFATVATSTFTVPPGAYQVVIDSDDGVRVRLDGRTIHEDWTWHPTRTEVIDVELDATPHRFEVEHFEIDGHATLGVRLIPRPEKTPR